MIRLQVNLNGVVKNAEARLNYTNLTFGTNTFADTTSRLYTNSGTVNLQDNEINNYNINYCNVRPWRYSIQKNKKR